MWYEKSNFIQKTPRPICSIYGNIYLHLIIDLGQVFGKYSSHMEHIYRRCEILFFYMWNSGILSKGRPSPFSLPSSWTFHPEPKERSGKVTPFVWVVPIGSFDVVDGGSLVVSIGSCFDVLMWKFLLVFEFLFKFQQRKTAYVTPENRKMLSGQGLVVSSQCARNEVSGRNSACNLGDCSQKRVRWKRLKHI